MSDFYYDATIYAGSVNIENRLGVGVKPPIGKLHYSSLRPLMGQVMEYCFIHSMIMKTKVFRVYIEEHGPDGHLRTWNFDIDKSVVDHFA